MAVSARADAIGDVQRLFLDRPATSLFHAAGGQFYLELKAERPKRIVV